jgi:hypothetical protein
VEDQSDSERRKEALQLAYKQAATSYEAITQFRGALLGLLPLATGIGAFLLLRRQDGESLQPLGPDRAARFRRDSGALRVRASRDAAMS